MSVTGQTQAPGQRSKAGSWGRKANVVAFESNVFRNRPERRDGASIGQGAAAGRHAQGSGRARSRGPVGIDSGQLPDRPAGPAFARAISGHRAFPSWATASPGVGPRTNSPPTAANARPAWVLLRSRTVRSPILDRSPSKWRHSLQCVFRLPEQTPIVSLHFLGCNRQPGRSIRGSSSDPHPTSYQ